MEVYIIIRMNVARNGQYRTDVAWLNRGGRTAVRTWPRRPAGVGHRLGGRTKEETAVSHGGRRTKDGDGAPWRCGERRGHNSSADVTRRQ